MEHLTFKGTAGYPSSRAISEAVEGVGGSANAATDRESTVYWARVPRREAGTAMAVLGQLIVHPTLDDADIDQERTVIVEEIRSYFDDPSEYAQMLIQQALFGEGPLGREICGDEAGIRALPTGAIRDFWRAMYRPANTVVAVAGDLEHDEAVELAAAAFGTGNGALPGFEAAPRAARRAARPDRQARHVPGPARDRGPRACAATIPTPGRWPCSTRVLGDGMSSRLFLGVREEKGLAYDVSSGIVEYADSGALEISAGVDPDQLPAAIEAILAELVRMVDEPVPDEELAKAKALPLGRARAADGRHAPPRVVDRRPGGAPRPRVHARRGARVRRGRPVRRTSPAWPPSCSATRPCGWPSWPRRGTCGGSNGTSGCRGDPGRRGRADHRRGPDAGPAAGARASPARLALVGPRRARGVVGTRAAR